MRARRWIGAAATALALAITPGALRFLPPSDTLDRADVALAPVDDEPATTAPATTEPAPTTTAAPATTQAPPPATTAPAPAAPATTAPPSPPPAAEVVITPPPELTGEPAPAAPPPALYEQSRGGSSGTVFALVVGINDYPGSEYDLSAAVADADTVNEGLARFGVPAGNRVVLRDGQARRDQVVAAVKALVQRAGAGSTIVFAYSGHVRKLDSDTEAIITAEGGVLTDQQLASLLAPSQAANMWVLLAGCYGGGFTELLGPNRILTAAAPANALAYESPSLKGSYLVHHMVREGWLQGKAGPSIQEAFAYADARIKERYPARRPVQIDRVGRRLTLGPAPARTVATSTTSAPRPATTTTTQPPRTCVLAVLCRET